MDENLFKKKEQLVNEEVSEGEESAEDLEEALSASAFEKIQPAGNIEHAGKGEGKRRGGRGRGRAK